MPVYHYGNNLASAFKEGSDVNYVYTEGSLAWQRGSVYSYTLSLGLSYSTGTYILANGTRTATLTVTLKTYINSVYQSDLDALVDADSIVFTYEPSGCDFSATRTSLGTYTISAASRGTVPSAETDATIRVNYTPPSSSQIYETTTVKQEANAIIDTEYKTEIELSISSDYDSLSEPADAGGASWSVTASGSGVNYERYQYTSLSWTSWVETTSSPITPSAITLSASGTGLSGSGTGSGTTVTWASRGTVTGNVRNATITASYSGTNETILVYQEANAFVSNSNYYISKYLIDGSASNYGASYSSGSVLVYGECTYTSTYTSGGYSVTEALSASDISISGSGFSYSNFWISYTLNDTGSSRSCTVSYSHSGASTVTRTISQASVVLPTVITDLALVSGYGTSATISLGGQVTSWGSGSASSYGIRYKLSSSGTWTNLSCSNLSSGVFSVSPDLTGISAGTYDHQAYATSSVGVTGYGDSNQFTVASAPSYSISVSPSGYAQNQGGNVQVTVTSSHGWNATVNKGDFFALSISASSGVSGDTPTISIPSPSANGTYNGNVTFTCGTATHVFYISVTIGL